MGRLQQNQSDLIATEFLYPTIGENLTNGPAFYADKTAFLSSYSDQFPKRYADVMQSFDAFSVNVWIMIMISALFMLLMISCSKVLAKSQRIAIKMLAKQKVRLEQHDTGNVWRGPFVSRKMNIGNQLVSMLFVFFNSLIKRSFTRTSRSSLSVATLTIMLLIMSFYVSFFFLAIVKTDKVVMTKPATIESYDDIINSYPGKRAVFFENLKSHLPFMNAAAGSKEGRIWQNAKRMGLKNALSNNFAQDLDPFARSEIIYIAPEVYMKSIACGYCRLRKQLDLTTIPMVKSDESAKENIYVFLLSGHLTSAVAARFRKVFGRLLTSGFRDSSLSQSIRIQRMTFQDFYVCLSNVVRFPDQDFSGISLKQCNTLIMTVSILCAASCIILMVERFFAENILLKSCCSFICDKRLNIACCQGCIFYA